jgi:hypothetical protein
VAFQTEVAASVSESRALQLDKGDVPVLLMTRLALYPVSQAEVT